MEFSAIFVSMSRVAKTEHMRRLAHHKSENTTNTCHELLAHNCITKLQQSPHVKHFYAGYKETTKKSHLGVEIVKHIWNHNKALEIPDTESQ